MSSEEIAQAEKEFREGLKTDQVPLSGLLSAERMSEIANEEKRLAKEKQDEEKFRNALRRGEWPRDCSISIEAMDRIRKEVEEENRLAKEKEDEERRRRQQQYTSTSTQTISMPGMTVVQGPSGQTISMNGMTISQGRGSSSVAVSGNYQFGMIVNGRVVYM